MNTNYIVGFVIAVFVIGLIFFIVMPKQTPPDTNKLQVVTSFYPLYFFASQIGGEMAEVMNITPAGAEPHDYEPTAQDIARIENSNLLILNGGKLESWGDKIQTNIDSKRTLVVTAGEGLATQEVVEDGRMIVDPHVWLSPPLAGQMVDKITQGFIQADQVRTDYYIANATALKAELGMLDTEYKAGLASCAEKNIITSHAAFGYLVSTYHLIQVPITGISPDSEPSPKQLTDIARFAEDHNVKYIFFESLVSPKLSETIANEVGAETLVLNPIEGLSKEELAAGKTYLTEMRQNLGNLKIALQCAQ